MAGVIILVVLAILIFTAVFRDEWKHSNELIRELKQGGETENGSQQFSPR